MVFDLETDGFLADVTKIHCLNIYDRERKLALRFNDHKTGDGTIEDGIAVLRAAPIIAGLNVHEYDVAVLEKLELFRAKDKVIDARAYSRLIWPTLTDKDFAALRSGKLPPEFQQKGLIGNHSVKAWGYRLGERKGEFDPKNFINEKTGEPHTWATIQYSTEMDDYCMQDVMTTVKLFELIESKQYDPRALEIENEVQRIIAQQQRNGWAFDRKAAEKLYATLQIRRIEVDAQLQLAFPPWEVVVKDFIPKVNNKARGYVKGVRAIVTKMQQFNPSSRDHISDRLMKVHGWEPNEFTDGGKPKVDETVLDAMAIPEAKLLNEYLLLDKRLGQIGDGKGGWLKCEKDGRIYGRVNTNGAVTGRMTHNSPNVSATPKVQSEYGPECRACWTADEGEVLVGCDASSLELCELAHFLARYDGGAYASAVTSGKKEDGTDTHGIHKAALDFNDREKGKTWTYAFLYGAGDYKLGTIVISDFDDEKLARFNAKYPSGKARDSMIKKLGTLSREKIKSRIPALGQLVAAVEHATKTRGFITGLDGRVLPIRHKHAALNTLLQSAGAICMKMALVILDRNLAALSLHNGRDYKLVGVIHDEFQITTPEVHAEVIGRSAAESIRLSGEALGLRCPLSGNYSIGKDWSCTH